MLTEAQIKEFQNIYREIYGKEISKENAFEEGEKLIRLFELIIPSIKKDIENGRCYKDKKDEYKNATDKNNT
ncbi:MAG TPA: hypothetical protein PKU93_00525 [Candidatus Pacearchaeota archaeon]|nr:hypothetical protein [Candidatus Pacearchaeota archaeon]